MMLICRNCGHEASFHGASFCVMRLDLPTIGGSIVSARSNEPSRPSPPSICDCDDWERDLGVI
ncbi:hypothetical protein LCGC14_2298060 [marine sediment metagenome]|uniref:Uncharacterized protein n=1 Tax=marine sediment metagenome TaxID=412755 RepID=A0A0F9DBW3_9ZZZZ